jgi:hypothetical protein
MTAASHRKPASRWRRRATGSTATAGLALSAGLVFGTAVANADVLDDLAKEFSLGSGAGQVANLLNQSLTLRAQGFRPKPSDLAAVEAALDRRPNQGPLIAALSNTVAHQQKQQSQMAPEAGSPPIVAGINTLPWTPGNPMIQENPIFPIPGRS